MKESRYMQVLAIQVASGKSVKDAATTAGCTESTAYSISCTPEFKAEVYRLKSEATEQAVAILTSAATAAAAALVRLLSSDDDKIVLAASAKLLDRLAPLQELHELRTRIDAIEAKQGLRVAQ